MSDAAISTPSVPAPAPEASGAGDGPSVTCGACRVQAPAGVLRCPACGGSTRPATAVALALVAGLGGLAAAAWFGVDIVRAASSPMQPSFYFITGLLSAAAAASVLGGRRAGWLGLHALWGLQLVVPVTFAALRHHDVAAHLAGDARVLAVTRLPMIAGLALAWLPATRAWCSAPSSFVTVFRREIGSFLYYPLAYVILAAFLLLLGVFFSLFLVEMADRAQSMGAMDGVVDFKMEWGTGSLLGAVMTFMIFCAPALTMRVMAEERQSGTIEMLMTAPVTEAGIILAKFFSVMVAFGLIISPSLVYMALILRNVTSQPDYGPVVGWYLGILFMASAYLAMGVFISTMTRNQIVAYVVTFVAFVVLFLGPRQASLIPVEWIKNVLQYMDIARYHETFTKGIVDTRAVVYDLSVTVFFLFLSIRALESRRWA